MAEDPKGTDQKGPETTQKTSGPVTADKVKQSEASKKESAAAAQGAAAVADAVKKVADAAVHAAQAAKGGGDLGDFVVSGSPGGKFRIKGNGFTHSGTVLLDGKQLETTGWGDENIEGKLPADAKSGEVTVWIDPDNQKHGYLQL